MKKLLSVLTVAVLLHMPLFTDAQAMMIKTIAGNGTEGFAGDGGPATAASFNHLSDIASDPAGNIYLADAHNNRIRKIDAATGIITTIAGSGGVGFSGDGGPAIAASINGPSEVKLDAAGNIYINDGGNKRIRRINAATGIITTIAGGGASPYHNGITGTTIDGNFGPRGLNVDHDGNCYFFDGGLDFATPRILRLDAVTDIVTAIIDSAGVTGFSGDGGPAADARIDNEHYYPGTSTGIDAAGNVYIDDIYNFRIRKVDNTTNIITTIAGTGSGGASGDGGLASAAGLGLCYKMAIDNSDNMYFFDYLQIRKIDAATHIITTIGGGGTSDANNIPATDARFYNPYGIAVDAAHNVYYSDANGFIRKLTPVCSSVDAGTITSSAGNTFCDSAHTILRLSGASTSYGISYQWQSSADGATWANVGTDSIVYVPGTIHTTTYFKAIVSCSTGSVSDTTAIDTILITHTPLPDGITGSSAVCQGANILLADLAAGGTWTSSNASLAAVNDTGLVAGVAVGTAIISYEASNSCGSAIGLLAVTVNPLPPVLSAITGDTSVCIAATTTLSEAIAGGSWNSGTPSVATIDASGVITGVAEGTSSIVYFYVNSCGGTITSVTVNVSPAPVAGTITGTDSLCAGHSLTLSDTASGGTWSSSNTSIAGINTTGIVTGVAAGTAIITYAVANDCGVANTVFPIRIQPSSVCNAGIQGTTTDAALKVYPNPSTGSFNIEVETAANEEMRVVISNVVGAKVKELTARTNVLFNVQLDEAAGVYLLSVSTPHGNYETKLVVIK